MLKQVKKNHEDFYLFIFLNKNDDGQPGIESEYNV
jgi:hypothetical protein